MTRRFVCLGVGVVLVASVACGDPEIVVPGTLGVEFLPPHGSVEISVDVEGLIAFSHEVKSPGEAVKMIELGCLGSPDPVRGCLAPEPTDCPATTSATVTFDESGFEARVTPDASLQTNTCYFYTVAKGIEATDNNVGPLPADRRSAFQTN